MSTTAQSNRRAPSTPSLTSTPPSGVTAAQVGQYLLDNPDFLAQHPEVIPHLQLPNAMHADNVANLQGFQLTKLQQKLSRVQQQNRQLLGNAQQNDTSATAINELVLEVLQISSLTQLRKTLTQRLTNQFGLFSVRLLLSTEVSTTKTNTIAPAQLQELFGTENNVRQRSLRGEDADKSLHGKQIEDVQSEALLPLTTKNTAQPFGVLVLGANSNNRFYAGQGSAFLDFFAPVLALTVERLLKS